MALVGIYEPVSPKQAAKEPNQAGLSAMLLL